MNGVLRTLITMLVLLVTSTPLFAEMVQSVPSDGKQLSVRQWKSYDWNASSSKVGAARFENQQGKGGSLLKIVAATPNDARFVQELAVEPDTVYRFAGWARSENVGGAARGAGISVAGILDGSPDIKTGHKEWRLIEFYGKTVPGQQKVTLTVGIGGYGSLNSGTVWFRDVTVEKVVNVPAGIRVAPLQPQAVTETVPAAAKRSGGAVIAFIGLLGLLMAGWGMILRRRNSNAADEPQAATAATVPQKKIERSDLVLMLVMSVVCLIISLVNLGSRQAPETGWQSAKAGESVTIELGRQVDLSRIYYYYGINPGSGDGSSYSLSARNPAGVFVEVASFIKDNVNIWKFSEIGVRTDAVRLTANTPDGRLNEIAFVEQGKQTALAGLKIAEKSSFNSDRNKPENLIDEQSSFEYVPSFRTGFYFDEIYHARTAWETLNKIEPYETTHPPLGKLLISSGIAAFGMNPFGWRIVGALFGVALVPMMYLFGLKLFRNRFYAFCSAFLMMFEFMRFAQSRIAVIDVFGVFFILLMYYFILDLFTEKDEQPRRSVNKSLLLAGTAFGIGAACKWIALYAGCGMVLLVILKTVMELRQGAFMATMGMPGFLLRRVAICLVAFGLLPAVIYLASYIPFMLMPGPGHGLADVFRIQAHMLNYHQMLKDSHPFASSWWSWPLDMVPMWMYTGTGLPAGTASSIASFGNPAIFWIGIPAVVAAAFLAVRKHNVCLGVVLVALVCQYLPWVGISRSSFIYHFFSTVPFLIICIVAGLRSLEQSIPRFRSVTLGYLGFTALLFMIFYPVLSGLQVQQSYLASLKWLPTWIF